MAQGAKRNDGALRGTRSGGFTAFEVLLATSILAIISLAVSSALMAGRAQASNAQNTVYASLLAQELMEEIMRLPYTDPNGQNYLGPGPGETTRQSYDNRGDYSGYTDGAGTTIPTITDLAGNAYPGAYQSFARTVTMTPTSYNPPGWGRSVAGLLVSVKVTRENQTCATVEQFATP